MTPMSVNKGGAASAADDPAKQLATLVKKVSFLFAKQLATLVKKVSFLFSKQLATLVKKVSFLFAS
jgi:hypothetical protein